jgi:hypothetical protein
MEQPESTRGSQLDGSSPQRRQSYKSAHRRMKYLRLSVAG